MKAQAKMTKGKFAKTALEALEQEHDKQIQAARENQQIVIYIFIAIVIITSWILGCMQVSFLWIFFLILLTFVVWWGKVLYLTEEHIKSKEIQVHRKRALRQCETAEWVNFVLNRWWVFSSNTICDLIKRKLDPVLADIKPSFLDAIELLSFSIGEKTPYVKYVHVYEYVDGGPGGKKPMSWSTVVQPPSGLVQAQQYQVVVEADVGLSGDDFRMVFRTRMGGKWVGMSLDIAVEKLNILGKMQFVLHLDMDMAFPHISSVTMAFLEKPEVWFSVRVLKTVQMMEIPGLKSWIHHLVMDALTQAFVDPGKVDIKLESTGPTNMPTKARAKANAHGVLTVTVKGEETKGSVLVEDTRYCQLRVGDQREHTRHMTTHGAWQDHCSFLIEDLRTDKLRVKSKTKVLLSTYTLANFEVALADFPFAHRQNCQTVLEEKSPKTGGPIRLELDLEYTVLPSIDELMENNDAEMQGSEVAGVMYVCMHSASNLLGLDRNGFSDPYCVLYSNGKKIKTTHYINRTKNPKWEVSVEFAVGDFTKTMLSFIVYDWDGSSASEDDFLGSTHVILTPDETSVVHRDLTLGYNLLNVGQVDNSRLGTITTSVIFRPVASIAKSASDSVTANVTHNSPTTSKAKSLSNAFEHPLSKKRFSSLSEKKLSDSMGLGGLLAQGLGILELHIIQAKDLVAMDLNGYSDPYVNVKIDGERKFTTGVKKKTLDPVWNEFVTLQLPKHGETLELIVWDKDAFFSKDFLGSITFTLDELKKYSKDREHDGWFPLHRIRKGLVQLKINVILEEPSLDPDVSQQIDITLGAEHDPEDLGDPVPLSPINSEADSGLPGSNATTPRSPTENTLNVPHAASHGASADIANLKVSDQEAEPPRSRSSSHDSDTMLHNQPGTRNTFPMNALRKRKDVARSSSDPKYKKSPTGGDKHDENMNASARP